MPSLASSLGVCVGGGVTHPVFEYPIQNGSRELLLSIRSRLEKGGLSLTQELTEGGLKEGAYSVGAAVFGLSIPRKASWISYN